MTHPVRLQRFRPHPALSRVRALILLLLAGCSKITDPTAQPYVREFHVTGTTMGQQATATVTTGAPGQINISGAVPVPSPCYTVEPDVALRAGTVQLTLYARPSDSKNVACTQTLSVVTYEAVLGDFGTLHYQVLISHNSGAGPVVDFTKDVDVL